MKKTILLGVVGLAGLLALPSMAGTQNQKSTAQDVGVLAVTTACYRMAPFCDEITVNIAADGRIAGWDDDCGSCAFQVGGRKTGSDFIIFLDFSIEDCGHSFRYGVIMGTGLKGTLYRYNADGSLWGMTSVELVPCAVVAVTQSNLGPASRKQ